MQRWVKVSNLVAFRLEKCGKGQKKRWKCVVSNVFFGCFEFYFYFCRRHENHNRIKLEAFIHFELIKDDLDDNKFVDLR